EQLRAQHDHGPTSDEEANDLYGRRYLGAVLSLEDWRSMVKPEHQPEGSHHDQRALNATHRSVVPEHKCEEQQADEHGSRAFPRDAYVHRRDEQGEPERPREQKDGRADYRPERDLLQATERGGGPTGEVLGFEARHHGAHEEGAQRRARGHMDRAIGEPLRAPHDEHETHY